MKKELVKKENVAIQVFDQENNQFIEVSHEAMLEADTLIEAFQYNNLQRYLIIKRMHDKKIHILKGYPSFEIFVRDRLKISPRTAFRYVNVAREIEPLLLGKNENTKDVIGIHSGVHGLPQDSSEQAENISDRLDIRELNLLAKLEYADFEELANDEMVGDSQIPSKTEFIKQTKKWGEERKKLNSKLSQEAEKTKTLASEKEIAEERLRIAEDRIEQIKELEDKYGPPPTKLKDKRYALDTARLHLGEMEQYLFKCNIDDNDPENLQQDLVDFLKRIEKTIENARNIYSSAISIILRNNV